MEESIRRAEKLVHATNSALAQMKYNLTFDNSSGLSRNLHKSDKGVRNHSLEEELKQFRSEANEMILKMDEMLDPSQYGLFSKKELNKDANARDRMKEINRKLDSQKMEKPKLFETRKSTLKFLSLLSDEELTPGRGNSCHKNGNITKEVTSTAAAPTKIQRFPARKADSLPTIIETSTLAGKSKEELKRKLMETQEIVNRGFQTARHLTHKFETITKGERKMDGTPNSMKTFACEEGLPVKPAKCDSNETISSYPPKCPKCLGLKEKKSRRAHAKSEKIKKTEQKPGEGRNRLIDIKRPETRETKMVTKLNFQPLPSVHIKGGLQVQKLLSLEIPPGNCQPAAVKANAAVKIISHDDIEKEKTNKLLELIKKENCLCNENKEEGNYVQCFNCGKIIRIQNTLVDPKEIDKLLVECSFDVFDPRIDEFVEKFKYNGPISACKKEIQKNTNDDSIEQRVRSRGVKEQGKRNKMVSDKRLGWKKCFQIEEMSQQLMRKYKDKANELESNHMEFESILRDLFKKIDDSRNLFDTCHFNSSIVKEQEGRGRAANLTMTAPFVVCLSENMDKKDENVLEEIKEKARSPKARESYEKNKKREGKTKKLSKKDIKNRCKSRTSSFRENSAEPMNSIERELIKSLYEGNEFNKISNGVPDQRDVNVPDTTKVINDWYDNSKTNLESSNDRSTRVPNKSKSASSESIRDEGDNGVLIFENEANTENDYESDFEGESPTFLKEENHTAEAEEVVREEEEEEEEGEGEGEGGGGGRDDDEDEEDEKDEEGLNRCIKKLSTISEVDSYLEEKISDNEEKSFVKGTEKRDREALLRGNNYEAKHNFEGVLTKAFEKGIEYTLKYQTGILEKLIGKTSPEEKELHSSCSSALPSTPTRKPNQGDNLNILKNSSPTSESKKNDPKPANKSDESHSPKRSPIQSVSVESLNEVLSALKNQFAKTETLADKLTENINDLKSVSEYRKTFSQKPEVDSHRSGSQNVNSLESDSILNVDKLGNFERGHTPPISDRTIPYSSFHKDITEWKTEKKAASDRFLDLRRSWRNLDVGGNLDDVQLSGRSMRSDSIAMITRQNSNGTKDTLSCTRRTNYEKPDSSSYSEDDFVRGGSKKSSRISSERTENAANVKTMSPLQWDGNSEASHSEGEVTSNAIVDFECSSMQSVGEVISEKISVASCS